ncbi:MAG: hypothetical protein LBK98_01880, partial [Peptococcaceae bacterium]|nr:hypothetical protein [Peptococcaceae bacterium]
MPKFSPESGKIALLGADGICRVYRAADGAPLCLISAATLADDLRAPDLESFSWSANGRYLACVSEFEEVFVFDVENGGLVQTPDIEGKAVLDALFIPGTDTIAVLGSDRSSVGQAGTLLSGDAENLAAGDIFQAIPRLAGMLLNAGDWEDKHLLFRIWRASGAQEYIPAAAILGGGSSGDAGDTGILMADRVDWTADGTFIRVYIGAPLTAALLTEKQNPR